MKSKHITLGLFGLGIIGLVFGVVSGIGLSTGKETNAFEVVEPAEFVPGPQTSETVERLKKELDAVVEYELAYGCVAKDAFGSDVLCGESKARVDKLHEALMAEWVKLEMPDEATLKARVLAIRNLVEDQERQVAFTGESGNPYSNDNIRRLETYMDQKGFYYLVDKSTGSIIQYGPAPNSALAFKETPALPQEALRDIAFSYIKKHVTDFDTVEKTFRATVTKKSDRPSEPGTMAFRWESSEQSDKMDLPAFVQLIVSAGGDIAGFNDTRSLAL